MAEQQVLTRTELAPGMKKTVAVGETKILVVHAEDGALYALEAECPHAKGPLEKGSVCNGRLVCPWHTGTFELRTGAWVEPPPLRGLKTYGVRWEGDAVMVDPEPRRTPTMSSLDVGTPGSAQVTSSGTPVIPCGAGKRVVFVGGGAAAAAAVCTLRQGGFRGETGADGYSDIVIVDPVAGEPVDRTNLSKMTLSGEKPAEELFGGEDGAKLGVTWVTAGVERMELPVGEGQRGRVVTSKGEPIEFDYALVATGGVPRKLGISGEDLPHVYTIRHAADVERIGVRIAEAKAGRGAPGTSSEPGASASGRRAASSALRSPGPVRAVIVGDSFIAFEAASALRTRGLQVTVVAREKTPFEKQFGEQVARGLLNLHRKHGVALRLGAEANGITEQVVTLAGGEALPAELVIVAVGVEPATGFGHGLRLKKDGSIAVGRDLRAAERVWVAGDIATVDGVQIEHWRVAEQHGRTAGFGMLRAAGALVSEEAATYSGAPFFWTFHFGKRYGYVGHAEDWDSVILEGYVAEQTFVAFLLKQEMCTGVVGCGQDAALAMLAERMREPMTLTDARMVVDEAKRAMA